MKGLIAIPIVIGSLLLIGGGALFGVAVYKSSKNSAVETKTYTATELGEFNKFDIDLTIADLEFKKADAVKVEVAETKYDVHTVEVSEGTLKIKGQDTRKWYEHLFNWNWFEKVKVTIYMPKGNYNELKVETATGNVVVSSDFTFTSFDVDVDTGNIKNTAKVTENIKAKTSTGNIVMEGVEAKNMELKTSTGDFKLDNVTLSGDFKAETSTGDYEIKNLTCENYTSKASTGHVNFTNVVVNNHIEIKNGTGHVKMVASDADTLYVKTSTGNINLQLLTSKICQVKKSTGTPQYPTSTTGGLCEVETSTGSVKIEF